MCTWFGHLVRASGLCKKIVQGTVPGKRKRRRQNKRWEDNIREWTGRNFKSSRGPSEMAEDCRRCQQWCAYNPDGSGTQVTKRCTSQTGSLRYTESFSSVLRKRPEQIYLSKFPDFSQINFNNNFRGHFLGTSIQRRTEPEYVIVIRKQVPTSNTEDFHASAMRLRVRSVAHAC